MIIKLKMYATDEIFGKNCLKAIRDIFAPIFGLWSEEEWLGSMFWWEWYPTEGEGSNFGALVESRATTI